MNNLSMALIGLGAACAVGTAGYVVFLPPDSGSTPPAFEEGAAPAPPDGPLDAVVQTSIVGRPTEISVAYRYKDRYYEASMICVLSLGAPCISLLQKDGWKASLRLDLVPDETLNLTMLLDEYTDYRSNEAVLTNAAGAETPPIAASMRERSNDYDYLRQPHVDTNNVFEATLPIELDGASISVPFIPGIAPTQSAKDNPGTATISFKVKGD